MSLPEDETIGGEFGGTTDEYATLREKFPVTITLRFRTQDEIRKWWGGLLDGWGENACDTYHPWASLPRGSVPEEACVENWPEEDDEE